jgi:hypothetical protein
VSQQQKIRRKAQLHAGKQRLYRIQEGAQTTAYRAAERVGPASQQARDVAAQRLTDARGWTAPRLRQAATYVEKQLGPRVGSMLSSTAQKIEPPRARRARGRIAATTLLGVGGALAGLGAWATRRGTALGKSRESTQEHTAESAPTGSGTIRTS